MGSDYSFCVAWEGDMSWPSFFLEFASVENTEKTQASLETFPFENPHPSG